MRIYYFARIRWERTKQLWEHIKQAWHYFRIIRAEHRNRIENEKGNINVAAR